MLALCIIDFSILVIKLAGFLCAWLKLQQRGKLCKKWKVLLKRNLPFFYLAEFRMGFHHNATATAWFSIKNHLLQFTICFLYYLFKQSYCCDRIL